MFGTKIRVLVEEEWTEPKLEARMEAPSAEKALPLFCSKQEVPADDILSGGALVRGTLNPVWIEDHWVTFYATEEGR
jgi:hypothetical protein